MSASQSPVDDCEPGDDDADPGFTEMYRAEAPGLLRFLRRKTRDPEDAQDIAQEAMFAFLRVAPTARVESPQAYLRRIAINLLHHRSRRGATKLAAVCVPLIAGLDFEDDADQHRQAAGREELAHWQAILGELKPRTLEIFLLSRVDGFSYKEIADRFGMTVWNVHRHMRKAIAHVARHRRPE